MLRTFLISTVIASILILPTTFTTITAAASVVTLTTPTTTTTITTTTNTTITPILTTTTLALPTATASNNSATAFQLRKTSVVNNKFLNNAAEETTTSLLPLQPPLNVTSTTLASFILNQKHQQQQRERKHLQQLYLQKQREQLQLQDVGETLKQQRQHQQQQQQPQSQKHLLNVNDNKAIKKKNLDAAFVTVRSAVDIIHAEPSSTHAYIPFDLDYNDPTEEKAAPQTSARQSTINEVLSNLFPKGFSDIFRFSYAGEQQEATADAAGAAAGPITVIRSTPTPFKPMPNSQALTREHAESPPKDRFITVSTTVTREVRREIRPGHTEIVVEKIITDPAAAKSVEDFKDGSNSISKDDLLRINRAAHEASVLPSLLVNPSHNGSSNSSDARTHTPIVILNEDNDNDDFVDAPEDDNQIAETQDVVHQVVQPPPAAESTNFHVSPNHQYNVRIIHDNTIKNAQDNEALKQAAALTRNSPSYQTFVEQSKYLQNSLNEAPSRKFLKDFPNPILTDNKDPKPIGKGNFHYEKDGQQNHIQTVAAANPLQFVELRAEAGHKDQPNSHHYQELHTQITASQQHLSDNDIYHIGSDPKQPEHTTQANLVFVTINPPRARERPRPAKLIQNYSQEPQVIPAKAMKSPHEFVADAMGYATQHHHHKQQQQHQQQQLADHLAEQSENNPKPSNAGYTFVEVQKSINIHNKLITEKDGRLIEQHETIYPEQKYAQDHVGQEIEQELEQPHPSPDYINLSQNPIHVEQEEEQHDVAASIREEQHALSPAQDLEDFGTIQQSNLIQESHIIETAQQQQQQQAQGDIIDTVQQHDNHLVETEPQHEPKQPEQYIVPQQYQQQDYAAAHEPQYEEHHHHPHQQLDEPQAQLTGEIMPSAHQVPSAPSVQIPYALPPQEIYHAPPPTPMVVHEILEKHIPVPYGVPEPVGIPVHIQHFIDRPFPVETIVEKPVPYAVEKVVEKVVEKHVPVQVEKIVEKPVEVIVKKYIDRPVAIPIKIPVALHLPLPQSSAPTYGPPSSLYPAIAGYGNGLDQASTWPQPVNAGSFTRIPQNILKAYYTKMLKKLVPQMQQAYKSAHTGKGVPKITQKPYVKPKFKISDILYDLKPPPPRTSASSSWDVGARYQYDYNTLPLDLSASSSIAVSKSYERPGQGYKTNYDEFQRWRNGHSLKRSPDFGRNLHMEYGFKPPLVPSIEIDDKGVPLRAVADLTSDKQ